MFQRCDRWRIFTFDPIDGGSGIVENQIIQHNVYARYTHSSTHTYISMYIILYLYNESSNLNACVTYT